MNVHRQHRASPWGAAAAVVLLLGLAGCGGSADPEPSAGSGAAEATTSAESEPASATAEETPQVTTSGDGPSGPELCDLIREVQSDLGPDAIDAAYLAQLAIRLSGILDTPEKITAFQADGDAAAKQECPSEHATFLEQAKIGSLNAL